MPELVVDLYYTDIDGQRWRRVGSEPPRHWHRYHSEGVEPAARQAPAGSS
jgi:hypothetical protein